MLESIVAPIMPAENSEALPKPLCEFFLTMRDTVTGPQLMIEANAVVFDTIRLSETIHINAGDTWQLPSNKFQTGIAA